MTDYILRESAIDSTQPNPLKMDLISFQIRSEVYGDFRETIKSIPAADVRPVVLCKNCEFTETDGMEEPAIYCQKWDRWEMPPDGYCYLGKRSNCGADMKLSEGENNAI